MTGSVDEGWEYVTASAGKSNYAFGSRLCSKFAATMKGNAACWWEEYCKAGSPRPNCWKVASGTRCPGTRPIGTIEISLYDLLREEFSTDDDQQSCIAELQRLKWNPTKADALPFATFKSKTKTLTLRAGYTSWSLQCSTIRNCIEPASLRSLIMLNPEEKAFWSEVHYRSNTFIADNVGFSGNQDLRCGTCGGKHETAKCRRGNIQTGDQSNTGNGLEGCDWCGLQGHFKRECRKLKAAVTRGEESETEYRRRGGPGREGKVPDMGASPSSGQRASQGWQPRTGGSQQKHQPIQRCITCRGFGHTSTVCPTKRTATAAAFNMEIDEDDAPQKYTFSFMGMSENRCIPPPNFNTTPEYRTEGPIEIVDEANTTLLDDKTVDFPLLNNILHPRIEPEVIVTATATNDIITEEIQPPSFTITDGRVADEPTGPVWTVTTTNNNREMMTIIDSGAVKAVVTRRTIEAARFDWEPGSDVKFIKADGTSYEPEGVCTSFQFFMGTLKFTTKVYIVNKAPFQLLLGTQFLWATGAGVFPRWNRVILTVPVWMEYKVSTVGPNKSDLRGPIGSEEEEIPVDVDPIITCSIPEIAICAFQQAKAIVLGEKDLIAECDGPIELANTEGSEMPTLTMEFIRNTFKFGPTVPEETIKKACFDILDYSDVYSWHEFDLGCITDVPHRIELTDEIPVVSASRPALYLPKNQRIIEAKCRPLVDMGVHTGGGQDCRNRAQLVIAKRQPAEGENPEDLKHYRVAHDFRGLNSKTVLDPWPMTTLEEMTMWVAQWSIFFKVDADRGFNQVVMAADSVPHTAFEMFHQLWTSVRMNFGVISGPATFARNADIMLGEQKFVEGTVKNYFDDIVGGAVLGDWEGLRLIKKRLLQRCRDHGWKLKPKKESFGFEELEIVGHVFRDGFISVPKHRLDALQRMRYPGNATILKSLLVLANTFRDRVPGFAIRVPNLTALTRQKVRITLSPEAIAEIDHLKEFLRSPSVLMCFQPGRKTYVYTDASVGHHEMAGGLEAVITQIHPENGQEYVCAYASAGLSPAQKNYHIARLEALAFVWVCGKFNNWMQAQEIIWRNDSRANKFIQDTKFSHNPALCRYALELQQFKYTMEWVPGLDLISDPLSRLVLVPKGKEALTLPELVFGRDLGRPIFAMKNAPRPGVALQYTIPFLQKEGTANRWAEVVSCTHETVDGYAFPVYLTTEFSLPNLYRSFRMEGRKSLQ